MHGRAYGGRHEQARGLQRHPSDMVLDDDEDEDDARVVAPRRRQPVRGQGMMHACAPVGNLEQETGCLRGSA